MHPIESSIEMKREAYKKNGNRTIQWASRELNNSIYVRTMYLMKLIAKHTKREKQENARETPNDRQFCLQPFTHTVCGRRVLNWQ